MKNIVTAKFKPGENSSTAYGAEQWDYGQILRIEGLSLPPAVEVHFSLQDRNGEAPRSLGETKDGVTTVPIPNSMLENLNAYGDSYYIYAWIYLTDETSGQTEYTIRIRVTTRSKPADWVPPDEPDFGEQLKASVMKERETAEESAKEAGGYAEQARQSAEDAKQMADKNGFVKMEIGDDGKLYAYRTENLADSLNFGINESGILEVEMS